MNRCSSCNQQIGEYDGAFCPPCQDDYRDREEA
jgi:hypothetical protein